MGIPMVSRLGKSDAAAEWMRVIPATAEVNNAEMKTFVMNVFLFACIDKRYVEVCLISC